MGSLFTPGSQTTTSASSTTPNSPVASAAYTDLINKAQSQPGFNPYSGQLTAGLQGAQQAGIDATYATQGAANPYLSQATAYANQSAQGITPQGIQANMNPYTQQVINATLAQSNQQDQAQQNQLVGSTVGSGGLGNSRLGVMQGVLGGQQAMANNSMLANLNSQNYQQATNTAAQNAQLAGQGAFAMGNLGNEAMQTGLAGAGALMGVGGVQQQTAQAADTAGYQNYMTNYTMPYQLLGAQSGIVDANGMALGSNTSGSQTTPTASPFSQILGGVLGGVGALGGLGGISDWWNGGMPSAQSWANNTTTTRYANGGGVAPPPAGSGDFERLTANLAHAVHHIRHATTPRFAVGGMVYPNEFMGPDGGAMFDPSMSPYGAPVGSGISAGGPAMPYAGVAPPVSAFGNARFQGLNPGDTLPMPHAMPRPIPMSHSAQPLQSPGGGGASAFSSPSSAVSGTDIVGGAQGGLDPFNHALMTAGFSLMGNKEPNIGTAIGQAGLAGVGDYDRQQANIRQSKLSQAELDQRAAQLDATVQDTQTRLKEQSRHDMAQEGIEGDRNQVMAQGNQRFQYQTVLGQDGQPHVMAMPTRGVADPSATSVTPGAIQGKQSSYTYSPSQIEDRAQKSEKAARDAVLNQLKITGEQVEPAALALRLDAAGHAAYQGAKMRYNNLNMGRPISAQPVMSPTGQPAPAMGPASAPSAAPAVPAASSNGGTIPEGQTATNPKTGERIIFKGGQWQPM